MVVLIVNCSQLVCSSTSYLVRFLHNFSDDDNDDDERGGNCCGGGFIFKFVSTCDGTCCYKKDKIMLKKKVEGSK